MTDEQLKLVTSLPSEDWGLGFIVMSRCLKYYKESYGPVAKYFNRAMKLARIDELRKQTKRSYIIRDGQTISIYRPMTYTNNLPERWTRPQPERTVPEIPEKMCPLYLFARGMSYQQISDDLGMPIGSVKSTVSRHRKTLQAARGSLLFSPSRGGIYRGSDSERSIRSTESETT